MQATQTEIDGYQVVLDARSAYDAAKTATWDAKKEADATALEVTAATEEAAQALSAFETTCTSEEGYEWSEDGTCVDTSSGAGLVLGLVFGILGAVGVGILVYCYCFKKDDDDSYKEAK